MKVCNKENCQKEVLAKGLCVNHYATERRAGNLDIYKRRDVCDCGKPALKKARFCRACAANNAEAKNKSLGITCKVEECDSSRMFSKGYCQKHSQQLKRKGKILKYGRFDANQIEETGGCFIFGM